MQWAFLKLKIKLERIVPSEIIADSNMWIKIVIQLLEDIKEVLENDNTTIKSKELISIDQAVKLTGIGEQKLRELVAKQNSDFPFFRVGSKVLINKRELIKWLRIVVMEHRKIWKIH